MYFILGARECAILGVKAYMAPDHNGHPKMWCLLESRGIAVPARMTPGFSTTVGFDYATGVQYDAELTSRISSVSPRLGSLVGGSALSIYGVGFGFSSSTCFLSSMTLVGKYFTKRRGLAVGLAGCGDGVGQAIFPPLIL